MLPKDLQDFSIYMRNQAILKQKELELSGQIEMVFVFCDKETGIVCRQGNVPDLDLFLLESMAVEKIDTGSTPTTEILDHLTLAQSN